MNSTKYLMTLGRFFYASAVVASGTQQLVRADFVRVVPNLPAWIPWHPFWAGAVGAALVVAGSAILVGFHVRRAATVLGGLLVATFVFQRVPEILSNPRVGFVWTNPSKVLALLAGALILAGISPGENSTGRGWSERLLSFGPILLGVFLLICGIQHFVYAGFVDTLVPAWLPRPRFWTCFTGVCLLAGGLGIVVPWTARWSALMAGLMILLWVVLLHIPRAIAMSADPGETSAIFEALAISGVAFLVAGLNAEEKATQPASALLSASTLDENESG